MKEDEKSRALLLTGGGAKGAFQIGALKHLIDDLEREYDLISGFSVGAISSALLVQGSFDSLLEEWNSIDSIGDVFGGNPKFYKGILSTRPLRETLEEDLDVEKIKNSDTKLVFTTVNLQTGELVECFNDCDPFIDWLLASAAIPGVVEPIKIDGHQYVDGGVLATKPLSPVVNEDVDEVDALLCLPIKHRAKEEQFGNAMEIFVRSLVVSQSDVIKRDIEHLKEINRSLEKWQTIESDSSFVTRLLLRHMKDRKQLPFEQFKKIKINIIQPSEEILNFLEFDGEKIQEAMEIGYEEAVRVMSANNEDASDTREEEADG